VPSVTDIRAASDERRTELLKFIHESRCRLLRLLVVIKAVPLLKKVKKCRVRDKPPPPPKGY